VCSFRGSHYIYFSNSSVSERTRLLQATKHHSTANIVPLGCTGNYTRSVVISMLELHLLLQPFDQRARGYFRSQSITPP
jgi:hypothetical protein